MFTYPNNFLLLQAWGVLEQRVGNLSAARRLFKSSLNINSQSYVTWMTWASMEEDQGNAVRAEEIRNLYFQQVTNCHNLEKLLDNPRQPGVYNPNQSLHLPRGINNIQLGFKWRLVGIIMVLDYLIMSS